MMIDQPFAQFIMSTCEDFLDMDNEMTLDGHELTEAIELFIHDEFDEIRNTFGYVTIAAMNETIRYVVEELQEIHPRVLSEGDTTFTNDRKRIIIKQKIQLDEELFKL